MLSLGSASIATVASVYSWPSSIKNRTPPKAVVVQRPCLNNSRVFCVGSGGGQKDENSKQGDENLEWGLEEQVDKMLGDMESQALMQDLNAAVERVARAKKELDALEEEQRRAQITDRDSLVEDCQREVFSAEMDMKNAEIALVKARAGTSVWDMSEMKWSDKDDIDEDAERLESGKAAAVSAVVGTLAGVPFFAASSLDGPELVVTSGFVFVSCALFGLTYRYAIRRDIGNIHLKAGCVAAFALVRGLAQIDASNVLLGLPYVAPQNLLQGGFFAAESIAIFCFASVGLEYCFRERLLSPFPLKSRP